MTLPRLDIAVNEAGLVLPPETDLCWLFPPAFTSSAHLPPAGVKIVSPDAAVSGAYRSAGYDVGRTPEGPFGAVLVQVPRAKQLARALIARACALAAQEGGVVIVDGAKTDGIESLLRACRALVPVSGVVSKAHGKLFWFHTTPAFAAWNLPEQQRTEDGWITAPGIFSADGLDPATALLRGALPPTLGPAVADLGAGWGALSAAILQREGVGEVHLVENCARALDCARANLSDERAVFHWSDATTWQPPTLFDTVVMNPPFHTSRSADPALGNAFIATASRILKPGGMLWMVANRHLPYEAALQSAFDDLVLLGEDTRYKLFCAKQPAHKRAKRPSTRVRSR